MNSHNRLIGIIGIALSIIILSISFFNIYDTKYLFYMQTLIVLAVCFHVMIGRPLWNEKMKITKLKSLFLAIALFIIFLISFFMSSVFRALVIANLSLFLVLFILLLTVILLIVYKGKK